MPRRTPPPWRGRPAFTLIEVLIVVAIIGLLATITLGVSRAAIRRIYEHRAEIAMRSVFNKIKQYRDEREAYPRMTSGGGTVNLVADLNRLEDTDVQKIVGTQLFSGGAILDPWGTPIRYYTDNSGPPNVDDRRVKMNNAPILVSAGVDTQFGTNDDVMVP